MTRPRELLRLALDAVDFEAGFEAGRIRIKRTVVEVRGRTDTGKVTKKRATIVRDVMKSDSAAREITLPERDREAADHLTSGAMTEPRTCEFRAHNSPKKSEKDGVRQKQTRRENPLCRRHLTADAQTNDR